MDKSGKTAIRRNKPSLPIRFLLESGFIPVTSKIFDYGHGLGDDMIYLKSLGFKVDGWDMHHKPPKGYGFTGEKLGKDIYDWVHLGYVLNVIPIHDHRMSVLSDICSNMKGGTGISVATRAFKEVERSRTARWLPYFDGWITSSGTFQKGFLPFELVQMMSAVGFSNIRVVKTDPLIAVASA